MIEVKAKKKIATAMKATPAEPICTCIAAWVSCVPVTPESGTSMPREQDHHRGRGADQDRVDEHAERLHEALRGRVVRVGRGDRRDVGRRAHAGLVGEQAALDAVEHGRRQPAGEAGRRLAEPEGALTGSAR